MGIINTDPKVWKYFKHGDIVKDEYVWGDKLFEVHSFHGNWYCPLMSVYMCGKPKTNRNMCNFDVRETKLITAPHRPFRKIPKKTLVKLMSKGNVEAKREFIMRINSKKELSYV